jgi:hypothetical protein
MGVARSELCEYLNCLNKRSRFLKSTTKKFGMKSPIPVKFNIGGRRIMALDAFTRFDVDLEMAHGSRISTERAVS